MVDVVMHSIAGGEEEQFRDQKDEDPGGMMIDDHGQDRAEGGKEVGSDDGQGKVFEPLLFPERQITSE